jgi:hypothetical protein
VVADPVVDIAWWLTLGFLSVKEQWRSGSVDLSKCIELDMYRRNAFKNEMHAHC